LKKQFCSFSLTAFQQKKLKKRGSQRIFFFRLKKVSSSLFQKMSNGQENFFRKKNFLEEKIEKKLVSTLCQFWDVLILKTKYLTFSLFCWTKTRANLITLIRCLVCRQPIKPMSWLSEHCSKIAKI